MGVSCPGVWVLWALDLHPCCWMRAGPVSALWVCESLREGAHALCVHVRVHACTQLCLPPCDPMGCSPPGSSVHEFFRPEYWRGLLSPSPGDLLYPRLLSLLQWQAGSLPLVPPKSPDRLQSLMWPSWALNLPHAQLPSGSRQARNSLGACCVDRLQWGCVCADWGGTRNKTGQMGGVQGPRKSQPPAVRTAEAQTGLEQSEKGRCSQAPSLHSHILRCDSLFLGLGPDLALSRLWCPWVSSGLRSPWMSRVIAYGEQGWILRRREFRFHARDEADLSELLCSRVLLQWKGTQKASDMDLRRGRVPHSSVLARPYILCQLVTNSRKVLPDPLPQHTS